MTEGKKEVGALGEKAATAFLKRSGYSILHKNFKCKLGEIDLIAKDGRVIVFVEVRTRFTSTYGSPIESILWRKRKKITMLANFYITKFGLENENFRFDVVSVTKDDGHLNIELIKDAFWEV